VITNLLSRRRLTFLAVLLSALTKVLSSIGFYLLVLSLGLRVEFLTVLWVVPAAFAASLFPSINGLGVREGTLVLFLGPILGTSNSFAVAMLWLASNLMVSLAGGVVYAVSGGALRNEQPD
jgi:uncharacterized membrane protein YbhN (UPF0104 family)